MGTRADQITSHLYSFGIRGKQFQYVEGKLPEGFPFHGRLTDHDVRNLQGRGAEVVVLNPSFTSEDLKQARVDCQGETSKTPNQADDKAIGLRLPAQSVATGQYAGSPPPVTPPIVSATTTRCSGCVEGQIVCTFCSRRCGHRG
jgi:hypothetical protein